MPLILITIRPEASRLWWNEHQMHALQVNSWKTFDSIWYDHSCSSDQHQTEDLWQVPRSQSKVFTIWLSTRANKTNKKTLVLLTSSVGNPKDLHKMCNLSTCDPRMANGYVYIIPAYNIKCHELCFYREGFPSATKSWVDSWSWRWEWIPQMLCTAQNAQCPHLAPGSESLGLSLFLLAEEAPRGGNWSLCYGELVP